MKFSDFVKKMRGNNPLLSLLFLQYSGRMSKDELSSFAWNSHLLPSVNGTINIGSPIKYLNHIYTQSFQSVTLIDVQGMFAIQSGNPTTFPDGGTTPVVANHVLFDTGNTAPTNITNFTLGVVGQVIIIIFGDNLTSLMQGANIKLSGGVNKNFAIDQTCMLLNINNVWYQIGGRI